LRGREFTDADSAEGAEPVLIINDIAAERFFNASNPLDVTVDSNGKRRIVGVVRAVRLGGPEAPLRPEVYNPFNPKRAFGGTLYVRTQRDPAALTGELRTAVAGVLRNTVVGEPQTFTQMYDKLIVQRRFNMIVLALFGVLAIAIAGAGIYGVMAYIVEQRTREIAVRMALGARPRQVLALILSRATLFMAAGVAIGLTGGWFLARFISAFLFRVDARDVLVYASASAVLIAVGLLAAFIPARRASHVDPIRVLR
jgi:putative ABC transport system permease protein